MLTAVLLLAFAPPEGENFYRAAKQGDWFETKANDVVSRTTAIKKTDDILTLRIDQTIDGKKSEPIEYVVDLNKPWPPPTKPNPDVKTMTEELGKGKETLEVAGKKYECEWKKTKTTISVTFEGKTTVTVTVIKGWTCPEVPLGGPVRTEIEGQGKPNVTELTGFGRGK